MAYGDGAYGDGPYKNEFGIQILVPVAIGSGEVFGSFLVGIAVSILLPASIESEESFGSFVVSKGSSPGPAIIDLTGAVGGEGDILFAHLVDEGYADIVLDPTHKRDLKADKGMENAVILSLFSNKRVNDEKLLPGRSDNKEGWWGSSLQDFEFGSKLWLLRRAKREARTLSLAQQYAREALQWMISSDIAAKIDVNVSFRDTEIMLLDIQIYRPEATELDEFSYRYYFNWENQIVLRG